MKKSYLIAMLIVNIVAILLFGFFLYISVNHHQGLLEGTCTFINWTTPFILVSLFFVLYIIIRELNDIKKEKVFREKQKDYLNQKQRK